jgi:hypothetical protein
VREAGFKPIAFGFQVQHTPITPLPQFGYIVTLVGSKAKEALEVYLKEDIEEPIILSITYLPS